MPVRAVGADELGRGGDGAQELLVGLDGDGRGCGRNRYGDRGLGGWGRTMPVAVGPKRLEQPRQPGMGRDDVAGATLEQAAPLLRDRVRVLEVLLEQRLRVARIQPIDVVHSSVLSSTGHRAPAPGPRPSTRASGR